MLHFVGALLLVFQHGALAGARELMPLWLQLSQVSPLIILFPLSEFDMCIKFNIGIVKSP